MKVSSLHWYQHGRERARVVTLLIILGIVVGVTSGLLSLLLEGVQHGVFGVSESLNSPGPSEAAWYRRLMGPIVASIVAAVSWSIIRNKTKVPSVAQAVDGKRMPGSATVVHVLLQIGIVGSGMSIGREVAPRELGALIAQYSAARARLQQSSTRMVVAIAAGAGLAGVYNAPLAGSAFTIEILLADVSLEVCAYSLLCSSLAAWVASWIRGNESMYAIGELSALNIRFMPSSLLVLLAIGLCCGLLGALFRNAVAWAGKHKASPQQIIWQLPIAGVVTGIVALVLPNIMGNGRVAAQFAMASQPMLSFVPLLVALAIAKASVTLLTIRAGASGGVLTPSISLGAIVGAVLGITWLSLAQLTSFQAPETIVIFAIAGAVSFLASAQHAPLMALMLVMELCRVPLASAVPLALCAGLASVVSLWYTRKISKKSLA